MNRFPLLSKALMVGALIVLLGVPLMMINGVIGGRQHYHRLAVQRVAASSAGAQALAAPVLVVPYVDRIREEVRDAQGTPREVTREVEGTWTYFPREFALDGALKPQARHIGLHTVRVYELDANAQARFDVVIPATPTDGRERRIGEPWLAWAIADVRGLAGSPRLRLDGRDVTLRQGQGHRDAPGVHVRLHAPAAGARLALATRLDLVLAGTQALALVPLADRNTLALRSTWPHPSFGGSFLPRTRRVDATGFQAKWEVSSLATAAQSQFRAGVSLPVPGLTQDGEEPMRAGATYAMEAAAAPGPMDAVQVALIDPVNPYTLADRASKYGLLFVALTFLGFLMLELIRQLRIHPIQYGLVGLALAIFFLLLVSLSEHMRFGIAYLAASLACIGLLGFYVGHVMHSRVRGLGFAIALGLLYAVLYGLLLSEQNALVLGSGLLFLVLAAVMVATRRIDWYQLSRSRAGAASGAGGTDQRMTDGLWAGDAGAA